MGTPSFRKLRGYAFDPSLSNQLDTFQINEIVYEIPWEEIDYSKGSLRGEYVEIIDFDPTIGKHYDILNLNDTYVLSQQGLDPSESNPRFHQQMVYAVVMTTIKNFEHALGRKIIWSGRRLNYDPENGKDIYEEYVDQLRIYPHGMRGSNAYYSPKKKALLFGYFHSNPIDQSQQMPNSLVFTCLSHDIIAHETTHAILDGMQKFYNEPSNPDVLAFHEMLADVVALFQHFSFPDVLKHQITKTQGDLGKQNLLGQLAYDFGVAIGNYGSLRDAIGRYNENKEWVPHVPDPMEYATTLEPHARASIVVAAIFEAFLAIYKRRIIDLFRIASNGTGILPEGDLHPDLVNRLANEAAKTSKHILNMCIRALDYCPPVDITFGDYLQAIITADYDISKKDPFGYRLAFIDAFKKRGIYPKDISTLSVESLLCSTVPNASSEGNTLMKVLADFLRDYAHEIAYVTDRKKIYETTKSVISGHGIRELKRMLKKYPLYKRIRTKFSHSEEFIRATGLEFNKDTTAYGIAMSERANKPSFQIYNLRLVSRVGPDGNTVNQVVFSIIQRCGVLMEDGKYNGCFIPEDDEFIPKSVRGKGFQFRGGCTLIMDLDDRNLKYIISKPILIRDQHGGERINTKVIEEQWKHIQETKRHGRNEFQLYFAQGITNYGLEPFALLHQH